MAEKKTGSRAEKKITDSKKNTSAGGSTTKSSSKTKSVKKKPASTKKTPKVKTEYDKTVPNSFVIAFVSLALFILLVVISINPEGILLKFIKTAVLGLVGQAGFYFSIPALLYLFVLHTFMRKSAVKMRSICTMLFVFFSGVLYHLIVQNQGIASGVAIISDLFEGGSSGSTGGLLCGGFAVIMRWILGTPISFLVTILCTVLSLLGAMQITIPSIIRAIANRPREDWDEEDEEEYIEPAAKMVNHIANKQIEQKRQRRERAAQQNELPFIPAEELPEPVERRKTKKEPESKRILKDSGVDRKSVV